MNLFQQLTAKPWLATGAELGDLRHPDEAHRAAKRTALWVFLAVVSIVFMLLLIAYGTRMAYEDWRPAPQLRLLWANTFVLILSSIALQWAQFSVRRRRMDAMRIGLLAAGAFTVVFLFGQLLAWRQLGTMGYFDVSNPAIAFF